jgi:hypothetical protein
MGSFQQWPVQDADCFLSKLGPTTQPLQIGSSNINGINGIYKRHQTPSISPTFAKWTSMEDSLYASIILGGSGNKI